LVGKLPVVSPWEVVLTTLVESLSVNDEELEELDEESEVLDLEPFPLEELSSLFDTLPASTLTAELADEFSEEALPRSLAESFFDFDFSEP
jgi:hypothetical protein